MRAHEREHQSAVGSVVFEHAFGKERAVRGPAPYHSVYPRHARYLCIARIRTTYVRAARGLESHRVVRLKEKVIVAQRVCAQFWVVVERTECERRTATPTPHHLRRHQLLSFGAVRV